MTKMRAIVWRGKNDVRLEEVEKPTPGYGDALVKVTTASICASDVHFVTGAYPIPAGLILSHEFVGVIDELGPGVSGWNAGDRVAVGAIAPCGQCYYCQKGSKMQCQAEPGGGMFGNTINGCNADYVLVPHAQFNLAKIPDNLTDEQVLFCGDIMTTGFSASDRANVQPGDTVAIFAQGPVGLCATVGARLRGAAKIITVESIPNRQEMSRKFGADIVLDPTKTDVVHDILNLTEGRGADITIEALGKTETFEAALRAVRRGGILSSLGVYSGDCTIPLDAFGAGIWDKTIISTLCPTGGERINTMINLIKCGKVDLTPLITHRFSLAQYLEAYRIFSQKLENVLKVAIQVN